MPKDKKYAVVECVEGADKGRRSVVTLTEKLDLNSRYPLAYTDVVYLSDAELSEKITQTATGVLSEIVDELGISTINTDIPKEINMVSQGIETVDIPNGRYRATWSGRNVSIILPSGLTTDVQVQQGIKGIGVPCAAVVENGVVIVRTLE